MAENTTTPLKQHKSKKPREEKEDSLKHKQDDTGELIVEKKKKKKERNGVIAEKTVPSSVDPSEEAESSKSEKKKHKRKRETDEHTAGEPSTKKEKKKSKHDREAAVVADAAPSTLEIASEAGSSKKKDKNKRKGSSDYATEESSTLKRAKTSADAPKKSEIDAFLSKHAVTIHGTVTPVLSFDQLDVPPELKVSFAEFKEPTPIQACSWPPALEGRDVVGIAETGSGKTLAFGLPALARLIAAPSTKDKKKGQQSTVNVLVMAPTRELAIQTHETLLALGQPFGIASVAVFGGVDKGPQIKSLKNANHDGKTTRIIVGTPGRILDLVNDGTCDLSQVSYLVLDEADRMLDKGFENDIRAIIGHTKQGADRQTLMFSATWPEAVRRLAGSFQRDPIRVTVGSDDLTANSRVDQVVEVFDDPRSKDSRLLGELRKLSHKKSKTGSPDESRILVFVLYKKEATRVENMLHREGFTVGGIHGDLSQNARMEALQNFKTGVTGLLVATDVAARGLDIPNVGAVINYSFPLTIEDYIHRIGRTGRGGKTGKSITFFTGENHERALAGELARVLRESGFSTENLQKFPMAIKKKTHGAYGAFFRDDIPMPTGPTKIVFD